MNGYNFNFLIEPTTPPVIGDAAALERLCKQIGYLWFAPGGGRFTVNGRIGIATGAYTPTNAAANNAAVEIAVESRYQLPSGLMPPTMGATTSGEAITAGLGISAVRTIADDKCTTVLTGLDRPTVSKGAGIVAYVPAGTDISDELDSQLIVNVCNGQQLVIGRAIQDAMDGIYATPFSTAWAYAVMGGRQLTPVAVVGGGTVATNVRR